MKLFATLACLELLALPAAGQQPSRPSPKNYVITVDCVPDPQNHSMCASEHGLQYTHPPDHGANGHQIATPGDTIVWQCGKSLSNCAIVVQFDGSSTPCSSPGTPGATFSCPIQSVTGGSPSLTLFKYTIAVAANSTVYVGDPVVIVDNGVTIDLKSQGRKPASGKP